MKPARPAFHFVDEAAPPKSLKALAAELKARQLDISWWGNIRFENPSARSCAAAGRQRLHRHLRRAGSGLRPLADADEKGRFGRQVARVTKGFADAGILVHAYLMYGFPTQTAQDTVDALEYVRQLFEQGCIHSGFFHRFACTVHSPVGKSPQDYGVSLLPLPPGGFAQNDVGFVDPTGVDHDRTRPGSEESHLQLYARHRPGRRRAQLVTVKVPKTTVARHRIARALEQRG